MPLPPDKIAGLYSYGILYGRQAVPESIINEGDTRPREMLFKNGTLEADASCKTPLSPKPSRWQQEYGSITGYVFQHNCLCQNEDSKGRKLTYAQSVAELQPLVNHEKSIPKQRLDYSFKSFLCLFLPVKLK